MSPLQSSLASWKKNLYVIWAIQILSLAGFGFGIPFLPFYIQEMGVTDPDNIKQWTGWMASSTGLTMGLMAPVWGYMADKYGKKLMLLRATLSGTLIISAMGLINTPSALLWMRVVQGMFSGTVSASVTLVASGTPREKSGYALGFLSSSTFIGFSLGPLAGGLAAELLGYRYSFFIGGAILFVAMILTLFFVKELSDDPEPDKRKKEKETKDVKENLFSLIKPMIPLFALLFCLRLARTMPGSFLPLRIQEMRNSLDGSSVTMGYISAMAGLVTAFAGIMLGRLGDRNDRLKLIIICTLAASILEIPTALSQSVLSFSFFYIMLAFSAGGIEPQLQSLISVNIPSYKRGAVFGIQTMVGSMGWAIAPLLGSYISVKWSVATIFLGSALFFLLAALVGFLHKKGIERVKKE
jgi:DHA1 family multidrug resistance protein-like MFS transporter